ncbi:MAG TPA: NAD-dependent epimerase/dehydratase family protein, partial [Bellilinea sp.]|nr:NAD-dependent epimerase/dehydratase family protein [Bellilinea sp.]
IGEINNIDTVCLRIFNAYGPGQHIPPVHAPVIMSFLKHALGNGTLVVHGDGSQTRDYIYVDDVVNALVAAATATDVNRQIINIGSGEETSLKELVRLVLKVTGRKPEVVYNLRSDAGNNRMAADISLAARKLRWKPLIDLETGIRYTMERDPRFAAKLTSTETTPIT